MSDYVVFKTVHKGRTIVGDYSKTYILHVGKNEKNLSVLIFHKHVFTNDHNLYNKYGFELLKTFKGKGLYKQVFSIKVDTFKQINQWVDSLPQTFTEPKND
jgi:hypothetical protein